MGTGDKDLDSRGAQELNARIIEAMPGGIVHVAADGTILTANAEALRVLGLSFDEITRKYTVDFETQTIWEDGTPCAAGDYPVTRALVTGEPQPRATIGVRRPDGDVSWAVFTAVPVKDPDTGQTTGAVVTFLDITDRKRAEERLLISDRMASIGTLAAGVAHEINNPLTYVLSNLDLLERRLIGEGSPLAARARDALEGADRIRAVVRDLSAFSHTGEDQAAPLVVKAVLESSLRMAHNELRFRAQVTRDYGAVPYVYADPGRLGQVFLNLLVNAAQSIEAGNVADNEVTVATTTTDQGWARITIADTGCGIPEDVRERLFEPFVTTKPMGVGNGLGLYICRDVVESLGGRISIESRDRGTAITVELPPAERAFEASASPRGPRKLPNRAARVLVVDDEPQILRLLEAILDGHHVTCAASGREAITQIAASEFDVLLCDLLMPDLTGMDVFEHIAAERPALASRVVFMTGAAFTPRARELIERASNPVLHKPFDADQVLDALGPLLSR